MAESKLKVLVLGGGGREHALAWKLSQSPRIAELICAPGNPGTAGLGRNVDVNAEDAAAVVSLARREKVDLVVVGPEAPLVAGVSDALRAAAIPVFGPSRAAAAIEGSKAFAKEIMAAAGVPTAEFRVFTSADEAVAYAREKGRIVVKADGLASGKGVIVATQVDDAVAAVRSLAGMGPAGARLVLEELLEGPEVSIIALCDGARYALLPPAQDHKRLLDGDRGPNTGGMGAYCPVPFLAPEQTAALGEQVIAPVLRELARRGTPFVGALYAGLMLTEAGPKVLEFNCRMGDPETQVLMMQVDEDLLPLFEACAAGRLAQREIRIKAGYSVGVVMAAAGYPGQVRTGDEISGLGEVREGAVVFQAGTKRVGERVVTSGGRVLAVCARGERLDSARSTAYAALERVRFAGSQHRVDIGGRVPRTS